MDILLVEDDKYISRSLSKQLSAFGQITVADNLIDAKKVIESKNFDLSFIDLNLGVSESDGLGLLPNIIQKGIYPVILTSNNSEKSKEAAFNSGCKKYVVKSKFSEDPQKFIKPILESLNDKVLDNFLQNDFFTKDETLIESIRRLYKVVINGSHSILLTGETGVGKTTIAKLVHTLSKRSGKFVHINIAEIKEELLESELFGHAKGSFTGAIADKKGYFEEANGGTLFLDEIDSLPKHLQVKIQVALEERAVARLGETTKRAVDFNLITATCQNLKELITKGLFRQDFYFRINGYELTIPPLRERPKDIALFIEKCIQSFSSEVYFETKALELLKNYDWPGNVRQLNDVLKKFEIHNTYHIMEEDVYKILDLKKDTKEDFLNKKMKEYIYKNGFNLFVEQLESEIMKDALKKTTSRTSAAQLIGIGNRKGARIHKRAFKAGL